MAEPTPPSAPGERRSPAGDRRRRPAPRRRRKASGVSTTRAGIVDGPSPREGPVVGRGQAHRPEEYRPLMPPPVRIGRLGRRGCSSSSADDYGLTDKVLAGHPQRAHRRRDRHQHLGPGPGRRPSTGRVRGSARSPASGWAPTWPRSARTRPLLSAAEIPTLVDRPGRLRAGWRQFAPAADRRTDRPRRPAARVRGPARADDRGRCPGRPPRHPSGPASLAGRCATWCSTWPTATASPPIRDLPIVLALAVGHGARAAWPVASSGGAEIGASPIPRPRPAPTSRASSTCPPRSGRCTAWRPPGPPRPSW